MTWYGIWNELKLDTLTPDQKDLLGVKLLEFPSLTLDHFIKRIKNIRTSYPWNVLPSAVLAGLVSYALVCCVYCSPYSISDDYVHISKQLGRRTDCL